MKILYFTLLFVGSSLAAPEFKIVGGQEATPNEFPYMISIQDIIISDQSVLRHHFCGGSLLNENWVLTAAHCIIGFTGDNATYRTEVVAGAHSIKTSNQFEQRRTAIQTIKHPDYQLIQTGADQHAINDLAVIKVNEAFSFNQFVNKINLRSSGPYYSTGSTTLSGWGSISRDSTPILPDKLQKVELELLSALECFKMDSKIALENICAGNKGNKSCCSGDSGGPLVQKNQNNEFIQIGVVSWTWIPCGKGDKTGVFANVLFYLNWIQKQISDPK
ncbi:hypothetical protein DMENIID0001_068770 [Sergentomyia squamirostris]